MQGKRDLPLLQLFYHHKSIELMRDTIEDLRSTTSRCRDIEKEELIDRLHDWVSSNNDFLSLIKTNSNATIFDRIQKWKRKVLS